MKTLNPRVFLREGELYAFVEELPTAPKYSDYVQHDKYYWQVKKYDRKKRDFDATIERAKASAIKVKNQEESLRYWNHEQLQNEGFVRSVNFYTLEGYQMEVEEKTVYKPVIDECGIIPQACTVKLAIISPVVEQKQEPFYPVVESEEELQIMIKRRVAAGVHDAVNGKSEYALAWRQCLDFVLDRYTVSRKPLPQPPKI